MAADDESVPEPQAPVSTPYLVTQPDGSTATYTWHTNRPPTIPEVANYAASQGQTFAGLPEAAPAPAAEPAAPSLAPEASLAQRAQRAWDVPPPRRSLASMAPSIGLSIPGAMYGASIGAVAPPPFDLVTIPAGGIIGAMVGGGAGEAAQYGVEQLTGAEPAEPGTLGQRVGSAALRQGAAEVVGLPFRAGASVGWRAVRPAAEAARELEPILTGTAPAAAPVGTGAAETLSPKYLLPQWWQANAAGKAPGEIIAAWQKLTPEQQLATAGEQLPVVQNYVAQLAKGTVPWSVGRLGWGTAVQAPAWLAAGHPNVAISSVLPAARDLGAELFNKSMAGLLTSPTRGVPWLATLPRAAEVAGPMFAFSTRTAAQPFVAEQWPAATDLVP